MISKNNNFTVFLVLATLVLFLSGCSSSNTKSNRNLSSIFDIPLDSSIEEIIEFELSSYGNFEYDLDTDGYGRTVLGFAPYSYHDKIYHKHKYFFDHDTEQLQVIEYGTIQDIQCHDESNVCIHVETIKDKVSNWDEMDSNGRMVVFGNIDGVGCKIVYSESIELISFSIEG